MTHEMLVALEVEDDDATRIAAPHAAPAGGRRGGFRYDVAVARTLRREVAYPIHRVFTIHFRDRAACARLLADPEYARIRAEHFAPAVRHMTVIVEYDR